MVFVAGVKTNEEECGHWVDIENGAARVFTDYQSGFRTWQKD
jgi:hypothetical protein